MKRIRATSGPFAHRLHYSSGEIDRSCHNALTDAGLFPREPSHVRIDRFVEKHFNGRIIYEDLGADILGCTVFNADGTVQGIHISDRLDDGTPTGERRLRSTIAHEAGHALFHHSLFTDDARTAWLDLGETGNIDLTRRRVLCRQRDVREGVGHRSGYDGRWWEWQANRAIGGFLLPVELVYEGLTRLTECAPLSGMPRLPHQHREAAIQELIHLFGVNYTVARIRLDEIFPRHDRQIIF